MKKAILNSHGDVRFLLDESVPTPSGSTSISLTTEQMQKIESGKTANPKVHYTFLDGVMMTLQRRVRLERGIKRRQTKLVIMRRLDALGKWQTFKAVMAQMPEIVQDSWNLAQEINEGDPLFDENKEALMTALGIDAEQFDALFEP